jgi:hypothetical protein
MGRAPFYFRRHSGWLPAAVERIFAGNSAVFCLGTATEPIRHDFVQRATR